MILSISGEPLFYEQQGNMMIFESKKEIKIIYNDGTYCFSVLKIFDGTDNIKLSFAWPNKNVSVPAKILQQAIDLVLDKQVEILQSLSEEETA